MAVSFAVKLWPFTQFKPFLISKLTIKLKLSKVYGCLKYFIVPSLATFALKCSTIFFFILIFISSIIIHLSTKRLENKNKVVLLHLYLQLIMVHL